VKKLKKLGLMKPAGLRAFSFRKEEKSGIYSFENRPEKLPDEFEKKFRENKTAWNFFRQQAPSYQRTAIYWILAAKQEKTKWSRLEKLIIGSQNKVRIW
jgi:uncharacterized protein YdeI (YjbR/CyaY-like superfamily)